MVHYPPGWPRRAKMNGGKASSSHVGRTALLKTSGPGSIIGQVDYSTMISGKAGMEFLRRHRLARERSLRNIWNFKRSADRLARPRQARTASRPHGPGIRNDQFICIRWPQIAAAVLAQELVQRVLDLRLDAVRAPVAHVSVLGVRSDYIDARFLGVFIVRNHTGIGFEHRVL